MTEQPMDAEFVAVYRLFGTNLRQGQEIALSSTENWQALLTTDPNAHLQDVDKSAAIRTGMLAAMVGLADERPLAERIAERVEKIRGERQAKYPQGTFLVFNGRGTVSRPCLDAFRDEGSFGFALDAYDKAAFQDNFQHEIDAYLAAITIALDHQASGEFETVARDSFIVSEGGKRIYCSSISVSGNLTLARLLTTEKVEAVRRLSLSLLGDHTGRVVVDLLNTSFDKSTHQFQSFFMAWNALEIFVRSYFSKTYLQKWMEMLKTGAPLSSHSYLIDAEEKRGRSLSQMFTIIASILSPATATGDIAEFNRLKKVRDGVVHRRPARGCELPIDATQAFVRRYMQLHFGIHSAVVSVE